MPGAKLLGLKGRDRVQSQDFKLSRPRATPAMLVALLLTIGPFAVHCQIADQSAPKPEPHLRVESNLVVVRVVVRDAHGQPIEGLKQEDFKLSDRGRDQAITQFEEGSPVEKPSGPANGVPAQILSPPSESAPGRFIAFFFDALNSTDSDLTRARDAAGHLLAVSLHPQDRVAIFTAEEMLTDFTSDPVQIHNALFRVRASVNSLASAQDCPHLSANQALEIAQSNDTESDAWRAAWSESKTCAVRSFTTHQDSNAPKPDMASMTAIRMLAQKVLSRSEAFSRVTLQQLDQVVKNLSNLPGERTVALVSPGFPSKDVQLNLNTSSTALSAQALSSIRSIPRGWQF